MVIEASIIVRTYNEGKHLARLLDGILTQEYNNREIIIVDSGSTDNTLDIANRYPVRIVPIRKEDFSFGYSLNVGCRNASGDFFVFVSGHSYPVNSKWLGNIIKPFDDPRVGMVYGRQVGDAETKVSEQKDMLNNFGEKSRILVEESFGNNANAAIRKSLWDKIPYDESLPGIEDIDWAHKIQKKGYYVYYRADAVICHIHDETYRQIYNRFKRESIAHKIIFPNHRFNARKALITYLYMMIRDVYFGLSQKKPFNNILTVFPYRISEYCGWRDGYLYSGNLNETLRNEFFFPRRNRSVVITGKNQHALVETEIPTAGRDEVLISVQYAGICSTDLDVLSGNLDYYKSGWASYPVVPGHEFSGIVAAVGENVRELKVGDRVVGECIMGCGQCFHCLGDRPLNCRERKEVGVLNFNGAYSRYIRMPARFAHKLSDGAPLEKACLIEPLAVSIRGVKKLLSGEDNRPRNAAVLGHGTIGNLCAQLMAARGHRVTVFDRNPSRLEGIGNSSIRGAGEIAGLEAYDLIIEATGRTEVLKKALLESPTGAKVLLLGLPYSSFDFNFENIVSFDKTVVGSVGSSRKDFDEAVSLYTELDLESLTKNIFPLEDYETAWILHREGRVTKAILKINGG